MAGTTTEQQHFTSQVGASAIASPAGLDALPALAPALHHLKDDDHSIETQLGGAAIAPPTLKHEVPPAPQAPYHHLKDEIFPEAGTGGSPVSSTRPSAAPSRAPSPKPATQETLPQTISTQIGPDAIAPPAGLDALPPPAPALHHLTSKQTTTTQVGPEAIAPPVGDVTNPWDAADTEYEDLPPFPTNVPTAPLLRISLQKLLDNDAEELKRLFSASKSTGFFYLDLRGAYPPRDADHDEEEAEIDGPGLLKNAEYLFDLGRRIFQLPLEEKLKYDFKAQGSYFGYKGFGAGVVDAKGTRDRNEFYNVSKDDLLSLSDPLEAPDILQESSSRALLQIFIRRSHAIVSLLLGLLNDKLGLPHAKLQSLHRLETESGDQVRWVFSPPQPISDRQKALGEHTDFGSLTLLHNRLGGLQVLDPTSNDWCYVKPLKNHCIVNLGDALVKFTRGGLKSSIHRVVEPPGEQSGNDRMSLVYFARPEDKVFLKRLEELRVDGDDEEEEHVTAKDWILRRALGRRTDGDWEASGGTEGGRIKS